MHHRRVALASGLPLGLNRSLLYRALFGVLAIWAVWAFAQEAWTAHRLADQAARLNAYNSALAAQNQAYQRDIAAAQSGGDAEEVARDSGYAKPIEKVYVVGTPPPAAASPRPERAAVHDSSGSFWAWVAGLLHRV
jgi:cell division protein FtsB